jgi:hypothetical protein
VCTAYAKSTGVDPAGRATTLAPWGEDVDLARVDLETQGVEELAGVLGLLLPVEQLTKPGHVVGLAGRAEGPVARPGLLVLPVRGDAVLGRRCISWVRIWISTGLPPGPDHRGVQRLVHVELRHRDVVLEPARHRIPARVHRPERGVAVADGLDEDPHCHQS